MARQSTLRSMRAVTGLLFLAVAGLIAAGAVKIRHDYPLAGVELIGWGFVPLALLLGFTLPVTCKVKRTNRKACGRWAYGLLFGCRDVPGHWSGKLLFRLGLRGDEVKPVTARQPKGSYATYQSAPAQSKTPRVTVEESTLAKCGFWIGLVSGVVGLIQAIIAVVH